MDESLLQDVNKNILNRFYELICPHIYNGLKSLYTTSYNLNHNESVKLFQISLKKLRVISDTSLKLDYAVLLSSSNKTNNEIREMIENLFLHQTKIYLLSKNIHYDIVSKIDIYNINVCSNIELIHKIYIATAEYIYKDAYLFSHKYPTETQISYKTIIESRISNALKQVINQELEIIINLEKYQKLNTKIREKLKQQETADKQVQKNIELDEDLKDSKESNDLKDLKDSKDLKDLKDSKDSNNSKDSKDSKDSMELTALNKEKNSISLSNNNESTELIEPNKIHNNLQTYMGFNTDSAVLNDTSNASLREHHISKLQQGFEHDESLLSSVSKPELFNSASKASNNTIKTIETSFNSPPIYDTTSLSTLADIVNGEKESINNKSTISRSKSDANSIINNESSSDFEISTIITDVNNKHNDTLDDKQNDTQNNNDDKQNNDDDKQEDNNQHNHDDKREDNEQEHDKQEDTHNNDDKQKNDEQHNKYEDDINNKVDNDNMQKYNNVNISSKKVKKSKTNIIHNFEEDNESYVKFLQFISDKYNVNNAQIIYHK
jgi:hypothetical protein